jgi:hypothetical protein
MYLQAGKVSSSGHLIVEKVRTPLNGWQESQKYGIDKNVEKNLAVNSEPDVKIALRTLLGECRLLLK